MLFRYGCTSSYPENPENLDKSRTAVLKILYFRTREGFSANIRLNVTQSTTFQVGPRDAEAWSSDLIGRSTHDEKFGSGDDISSSKYNHFFETAVAGIDIAYPAICIPPTAVS